MGTVDGILKAVRFTIIFGRQARPDFKGLGEIGRVRIAQMFGDDRNFFAGFGELCNGETAPHFGNNRAVILPGVIQSATERA